MSKSNGALFFLLMVTFGMVVFVITPDWLRQGTASSFNSKFTATVTSAPLFYYNV